MTNYDLEIKFSTGAIVYQRFGIKRRISDDVRITLGQQKNWEEKHEWVESDGFPKQLPFISTESYPILDVTILAYFEGDEDRLKPIQSAVVILQKGNDPPVTLAATWNTDHLQF